MTAGARIIGTALAVALASACRPPTTRPTPEPLPAVTRAGPAERELPTYWGDLSPGPHDVGYRQLAFVDETRPYHLNTEPEPHGRPVVAGIWYPALSDESGLPLSIRAYFELEDLGEDLESFQAVVNAYLREVIAREVFERLPELVGHERQTELDAVLDMSTMARRNLDVAVHDAPVLLAHPGLGGAFGDGFLLFELLATRGWVVVAVLAQGAHGDTMSVDWDPATSIRDLDVVRRGVPAALGIEPTQVSVIGHSYGAQAALSYAVIVGDVDTIVSLDSTLDIPTDSGKPWWADDEWVDRGPEIHVPTLVVAAQQRGPAYFDTLGTRDKAYVSVPELDHDEFEGLGGVLRPALGQCDSTGDCELLRRRYLAIVSVVDAFLARSAERWETAMNSASSLGLVASAPSDAHASTGDPRPLPDLNALPTDCRVAKACDAGQQAAWTVAELYALGRLEAALEHADSALAKHPSSSLMEERARVLLGLGRLAAASQQYEHQREMLAKIEDPHPMVVYLRDLAERRRDEVDAMRRQATSD